MNDLAPSTGAIDVHAHCVPAELLHRLRREGGRHGLEVGERDGRAVVHVSGGPTLGPVKPALSDMADRLAAMDASGVGVQLLSGWMDVAATALPATVATRYSRMFNESLVEAASGEPGRFRCFATLPLQSPVHAVAELRHAVGALGMVGAEIGTTVDGRDLDAPELEPFWAAAEEMQSLLLLHPCAPLAGRGVTRHFLGNLVGNPAESTIAVGHLVFGGVLERHPDLRLVVVHGGGFAPYQVGRWDHAFHGDVRGAAANLTRPPSHWVRRLHHDTVLHSPRSLRLLIDVVGAEHVVLGSDYPFEMGENDPVGMVAAVPGLTDDEGALVLRGNLERLLEGAAS